MSTYKTWVISGLVASTCFLGLHLTTGWPWWLLPTGVGLGYVVVALSDLRYRP